MKKKANDGLKKKLAELGPDWTGGTLLYVPIFGVLVYVFVGSVKDAIAFLEAGDKGDDIAAQLRCDPAEEAAGQTLYSGGTMLILLKKFWIGGDETVLYHECLHVANRILRDRYIQPDSSDEMLAWLQQYLVKGIKWRFSTGNFLTIRDGKRSSPLEKPEMSNMIFPG